MLLFCALKKNELKLLLFSPLCLVIINVSFDVFYLKLSNIKYKYQYISMKIQQYYLFIKSNNTFSVSRFIAFELFNYRV